MTTVHRKVALSFVIPSEAEGSAVPRTFPGNVFRPDAAEWSGEIFGFFSYVAGTNRPE
jgi:hypothetical protein